MLNQGADISTGVMHENFEFVLTCIKSDVNPMMVGPAGCGKTTIARNIAKEMGLPFHYAGAVESSFQLKGFTDAQGRVVETSFVKAYRDGGIFLFDEIDASDPSALVAIHAALDNGIFDAPGGIIHRNMNFHFMAAANTWGHGATLDYMGRNHLDGATLDRFIPVAMDYDQAFEKKLVEEKFPNQTEWADTVHKARAAARDMSLRHIISTRAHLKGAALLDAGVSRDRVIDSVLLWGLEQGTKIKLLDAIKPVVIPAASLPFTEPVPLPSLKSAAPATSFVDERIGQYDPEQKGIFIGLWQPIYQNGQLAPIECEVYAADSDLEGLHTYYDSLLMIGNIQDGRRGAYFKNQDEMIASLIDGSGIHKFFMPPSELIHGFNPRNSRFHIDNMYRLQNTAAFAGQFSNPPKRIEGSKEFPGFYWTATASIDWTATASIDKLSKFININLSTGAVHANNGNKICLNTRPFFVTKVRHLTNEQN